jgi:hypothetical protein
MATYEEKVDALIWERDRRLDEWLEPVCSAVEAIAARAGLRHPGSLMLAMQCALARRESERVGDRARDLPEELLLRVFGFALAPKAQIGVSATHAAEPALMAMAGTCRRWRAAYLRGQHALWLGLHPDDAATALFLCFVRRKIGFAHRPGLAGAFPAACVGAVLAPHRAGVLDAGDVVFELLADRRVRDSVLAPALRARRAWLLDYLPPRVNLGSDDAACGLLAASLAPEDAESEAEAALLKRALHCARHCDSAVRLACALAHPTRAPPRTDAWYLGLGAPRHAAVIDEAAGDPSSYADSGGEGLLELALVLASRSAEWAERAWVLAPRPRRRASKRAHMLLLAALCAADPHAHADEALAALSKIQTHEREYGYSGSVCMGALVVAALKRHSPHATPAALHAVRHNGEVIPGAVMEFNPLLLEGGTLVTVVPPSWQQNL